MIHVIATIQTHPGCKAAFLAEFHKIVPTVRQEGGCLQYVPTVDMDLDLAPQVLDETAVTIVEAWESKAALQAHLQAPHMTAYREQVQDLVASTSLKILQDA